VRAWGAASFPTVLSSRHQMPHGCMGSCTQVKGDNSPFEREKKEFEMQAMKHFMVSTVRLSATGRPLRTR
jgi:hypothetical protein